MSQKTNKTQMIYLTAFIFSGLYDAYVITRKGGGC